jgi:hypothetical protein
MRTTHLAAFTLLALGGAAGFAAPARAQEGEAETVLAVSGELPPEHRSDFQDGYQDEYDRDDRGRDRYQQRLSVNVWLENDRDLLRVGDHTRVLVRSNEDAFVAVLHIDADGDVEFLYPRYPDDDGYLNGGRTYSLGSRGSRYVDLHSGYGIGYVFAVASDEPLDLDRVRDYYERRNVSWSRDYNVYGDPFYAMERFEHLLVPDWQYGYHDTDVYSYHVGSRRYTYPRYACYESYGPWYYSRTAYYDDCDTVRIFLRLRPYYYDTRYYRGDRRGYYTRYYPAYRYPANRRDPRHGYKEDPGGRSSTSRGAPPRRPSVGGSGGAEPARGTYGGGYDDARQEPRSTAPTRQRPTLQRRPSEPEGTRDEGRREDTRRESPPARGETRRDAPSDRRVEPRRESPPPERTRSEPRAEPRRESSPPRRESSGSSGGSRSRPSEGSAPRSRPPAG